MRTFPGSLCHYTTAEAAFAWILPSRQLRLSPLTKLRDPLENTEYLMLGGAGFVEEGDDAPAARHFRALEQIARVRRDTRVLSLTEDASYGYGPGDEPHMRAWARARLWEHYANEHRGACLIFDREAALAAIGDSLAELGAPHSSSVNYTPGGIGSTATRTIMFDQFTAENFDADVQQFIRDRRDDLFYTKTLDWQSEHEFRVTVLLNPSSESDESRPVYAFADYGNALRAVVVGAHFDSSLIPTAAAACEQAGVQLLRAEWRSHGGPFLLAAAPR